MAWLCHPHIVPAHDADEKMASTFVMEYVEGADLGQIVASMVPCRSHLPANAFARPPMGSSMLTNMAWFTATLNHRIYCSRGA